MDNNYRQALAEVLEVLNHTDKKIVEQMPKQFISFILENADKKYVIDIDFTLENWENSLMEDTQATLAYIYKEYIATDDEKSTLLTDEELIQKGEQMLKKYGVGDLFPPKAENTHSSITENAPIEIKKISWYKKIFQKIVNIFK